jgi:hypothetical protein
MTEVATPTESTADGRGSAQELRRRLEQQYAECGVVRPFHRTRYESGQRLDYAITGVAPASPGRMTLEVERFVGGGFAGQVYRVQVLEVVPDGGPIAGLEPGRHYAIKILKPPSGFAQAFRDFLYFLAYQGHFAAQVHPASVRVGVLWQKLIRRAAASRFGTESAVCDTYATFFDSAMHSFGEINEWIDGRIWKFEVDDRVFERWEFKDRPPADHPSAEFVNKRLFMRDLVALLHEMGASELARQYEWWTCKSQPNALKRVGLDAYPDRGLTAVDFRAGLALLPFLPMSPADVALILRGLARGRIVQFDRSDPVRFRRFIEAHRDEFRGLEPAIEELQRQEAAHWAALPDVTRHGLSLVADPGLRDSIRRGTITAWHNLGRLDDAHAPELERRRGLFRLLYPISLIPLLGGVVVKLWGDSRAREHVRRCWTSFRYLWRAMRASRIEALVDWHRDGRVSDRSAERLVDRPVRFWLQRIALGWMPPTWHRSLSEPRFGWSRIREAFLFFVRFLHHPAFREEWLLEQVALGEGEGMLTAAEAAKIRAQLKDPYIQKYLRCLAVHLCTVPITHTLMLIVGAAVTVYCLAYRHLSWPQSLGYGTATAAVIQLLPISPGSIARGVFVIFLMIKERDFRSYSIAAPVSFLHVIGYLAFPLQMVSRNPALARFMAGRWAKGMVAVVPVFGESGGLLEHGVFDTFFNVPMSVTRRFRVDPARTTAIAVLIAAVVAFLGFLGYARIWEWRQPRVQLRNVEISSIIPYHQPGSGDLHWNLNGVRVRFRGVDLPVDYPGRSWDRALAPPDHVDAVVRRSFFGKEFDGLAVTRSR